MELFSFLGLALIALSMWILYRIIAAGVRRGILEADQIRCSRGHGSDRTAP